MTGARDSAGAKQKGSETLFETETAVKKLGQVPLRAFESLRKNGGWFTCKCKSGVRFTYNRWSCRGVVDVQS